MAEFLKFIQIYRKVSIMLSYNLKTGTKSETFFNTQRLYKRGDIRDY